MTVRCIVDKGNSRCGQRQLRHDMRRAVAEKLQTKSAFAYRNESAAEDLQDLGRLPSSTVMRTLKCEYTKKQFLDNNPAIALSILKRKSSIGRNVIHKIGYDSFFVYFWSSHQVKLYNTQVAEGGCSLAIDATGELHQKSSMWIVENRSIFFCIPEL